MHNISYFKKNKRMYLQKQVIVLKFLNQNNYDCYYLLNPFKICFGIKLKRIAAVIFVIILMLVNILLYDKLMQSLYILLVLQ